jgi:Cu(I)/Ag(I) efflux system membrane fusion protein
MVPQQHFDKPGKSPFMDMDLVPRYADDSVDTDAVRIDPIVAQNLGVRVAKVRRGVATTRVDATGVLGFDERDVAIVQARSGGFVERVSPLAPGDVIRAGAPIAELLVPEWGAAQREYLALRGAGDASLAAAARERMRLAGMPEALIRAVDSDGRPRDRVSIVAPRGGVVQELGVRTGMTLSAGQTLARINGIGKVWLDVAVPEALAGRARVGDAAVARFPGFPGESFEGRVTALLPALDEATRTLRVRVELPNRAGRLRPGLTATVSLSGAAREAVLLVPTEAVIRTGKRALVMLALGDGRYRPVEVTPGDEAGDDTIVLAGLEEGQQVVASGQFLIDSEASLRGVQARAEGAPAGSAPGGAAAAGALHEADATIEGISDGEVTLTHDAFTTLGMGAMTMDFPLANPQVLAGLKVGDRVRVGVRASESGLVVESLRRIGGGR